MKDSKLPIISGELLIADFQTAFAALATAEYANYQAEQSESDLLSNLTAMSSGSYLNPGTVSLDIQAQISRASLDAHVKKIQAAQLQAISTTQLEDMITKDKKLYPKRKVQIEVLDTELKPVEAVWFNARTGYRTNPIKKIRISGTIREVLLDKNMLVISPPKMARLINREFECYFVYIVNPQTLQSMVSLSLG